MSWGKKLTGYWNKPHHAAYLFIAPAVLIIAVFCIIPMLASFGISMMNVTTYFTGSKFIGWGNFAEAFHDSKFLNSWKVTGLYTVCVVPIIICFSLFMAALVSSERRSDKFFRTIFILPIICSSTVTGLMWKLFLDPNIGWGIYTMEKLGLPSMDIFSDVKLAIFGIAFITIWSGFGVSCMILVAAMQGVSTSLYEAASLDGANAFQKALHVTIPGISSTLWFILITQIIASFQVFDLVYVITNGGPAHSTETVVSYVYSNAFTTDNRLGYSTAMSEVLFVVILLITILLYSRMLYQEKNGGDQ